MTILVDQLHAPDMPAGDGGPAFLEPWHAEAFSLAIALQQQGAFSWAEWVEHFCGVLCDVPAEDGETVESAYYRRWLLALEIITADKHLVSSEDMMVRKEEWRRAYQRTPHGQPVQLERGRGPELREHDRLAHAHAGDRRHVQTLRPEPVAVSPARSSSRPGGANEKSDASHPASRRGVPHVHR
jgi:nitrile hydratase accessory protein